MVSLLYALDLVPPNHFVWVHEQINLDLTHVLRSTSWHQAFLSQMTNNIGGRLLGSLPPHGFLLPEHHRIYSLAMVVAALPYISLLGLGASAAV